MELRHLNYFKVLAEELHFHKAADRLYISQPGLSKQIKNLETELEVQLLERNKRNVNLTPAGQYLASRIQDIEEKIEEIVEGTRLVHSGFKGILKLGYIGSAMHNIIPGLLKDIYGKYPNIQFTLTEMENLGQIEKLLRLNLDLGFMRTDYVPKPLKSLSVFEDTFSLVVPKNHFLCKSDTVDLSLLSDEKFILFEPSYSESYYMNVMQIFLDAGFRPSPAHHTIHAGSIFRLVENGLGISIVPTSLQLGYQLDVSFIELKHIKQRTSLSVVWNPRSTNPILQNVIDLFNGGGAL